MVPELITFCVDAARAETAGADAGAVVPPRATVVRPAVAARAVVAGADAAVLRTGAALRAVAARADTAVFVPPVLAPDVDAAGAVAAPPRRCWGTAASDAPINAMINSEKMANLFIISLLIVM